MAVIGYHGTSRAAAAAVLATRVLNPSSGGGHWLGSGSYFFQDAPLHALTWARMRLSLSAADVVVIRCEIDLSSCLDLLDRRNFNKMRRVYARFVDEENRSRYAFTQQGLSVSRGIASVGASISSSGLADNHRDHALLDWYIEFLKRYASQDVTAVRGAFLWGQALFRESFLFDWSHCQIAVRDNTILSPLEEYQW